MQPIADESKHISLSISHPERLCPVAKALSSPMRVKMLGLLCTRSMNVNELADALSMPVSTAALNVRQLEECREIIKYLLRGESILLNLENIDPKDCGRVVDLLSGAAFALQGRMIKVAHLSYLLAPENVEIIESDAYGAGRARYSR